jgi:hypothetical protein
MQKQLATCDRIGFAVTDEHDSTSHRIISEIHFAARHFDPTSDR